MAYVELEAEPTVIERPDTRLGMRLAERYQIVSKIAAGGFGTVYLAVDHVAKRDVAVKMMHPSLAADATIAARFRREVEALGSLTSPHTVAALDAGDAPDGTPYLVMELLTGESVYARYKAGGRMPWQRVVAIARGVCDSLGEAHSLGIVHRDLKPENIHLERRGDDPEFVKVLDFGIAKVQQSTVADGAELTHVGQMVGTYSYMSPEQMTGTCTPESDVFTLGVVMYELIAGHRPFGDAKGPAAQLAAVLGDPPKLVSPAPLELTRIVARCIDKEPARRYRNAHELAQALSRFTDNTDEAPTHMAPNASRRTPPPWVDPAIGLNVTLQGLTPAPKLMPRGSTHELDRSRVAHGTRDLTPQPTARKPSTVIVREPTPAPELVTIPPTEPIVPPPAPLPRAERPTTATGVSSFSTSSWTAVVVAVAIAAALVALGIFI